jgi:OmpA-OmpF porin, OOP family
MKQLILGGLLVAACAAGGSAIAADAYDDTGASYIVALGQYTFLDKDRISKDGRGFELGLGHNFAPNFAAEIIDSNGTFRIPNAGAREKLNAISVDGLYKFLPVTSMFRPFILAGVGGMSDDIGGHTPNNLGWLAETGVGLLTGLGSQSGSTRWQLRTEVKYRYEFMKYTQYVPNDPGDIILGVGFQFMFGAPTPPPPFVARALPPPPPEPAPPPPPPPPPPAPVCHAPAGFQVDANCRIIQQTVVVRAVDFEFNSARLTAPAQQTLDEVATALAAQPDLRIEIQGYTDSVGADAYNLKLSQRRADAVKYYLVSKGVNGSTLSARGYGKANPLVSNDTAENRAKNRRVAFEVTNAPPNVKVEKEDATPASTEAAQQGTH